VIFGAPARITAQTYTRAQYSGITDHNDDRAELIQEIMAQLWFAYPKFDAARSFPTWMYRIALIVCGALLLNRLRKVEYGAPVVTLQKQLLGLEKAYIAGGWWVGLAVGVIGIAGTVVFERWAGRATKSGRPNACATGANRGI
jgi:hypothetical protein